MALIGDLRNKMGTWVVVFVFVAIAAFTLSDILGNNSVLFGEDREVGVIAGHSVSYEEFQQMIEEREANYIMNFRRQPGDREMPTLRQQAWELLILRHAIEKEYDKLGLEVTTQEAADMIYGRNIDPSIRQAFTNPETGEFDKERLVGYLRDLKNPPSDPNPQLQEMWQQQRSSWELFQKDLVPARERLKYENLLLKTNYVTTAEAEREYHAQTDVAEVKYVYIPYYTVGDSAAAVSDSQLKSYYENHKERFRTEESRDLKYVSFSVIPTAKDTAAIRTDLEKIAAEMKEAEDDSLFAVTNADTEEEAFNTYHASDLPAALAGTDLQKGAVVGPYVDAGAYKVAKVTAIRKDTIFSARASHILIKWDDQSDASKRAAREKARGILREIKAGADFAQKAREHGTDGTAVKGGDLGWFSSGRMVKPFEDAVFGATKTGVLNDVVETDFGYHIISVTNVKDNTAYDVAVVDRAITASNETINNAYRQAEEFSADITSEEQFVNRAKEKGYTVLEAKSLGANDRRIGNLGDARQVVQWAFRDAELNEVSEVFDLQTSYVVAILTGETEKGYRTFESVKTEITPEVRKEVQGKQIIDKLKTLEGSLEEIAQKYGSDANVYSTSDLKIGSNSLPTAGFDPRAVGVAFSLESGKGSDPFAGENGVFIFELQNKTIAPELQDYSAYRAPIEENALNRSGFSIAEAIKENAKIEDKRYKFY